MVIVILVILGLCSGSFTNALVWRLHEKRDWVKERSECVHCHKILKSYDLIPIGSWLMLKGKCRYCHKPISWQYPLVEALVSGLYVLMYVFWPVSVKGVQIPIFILWLVIATGLSALAVYDLKWMILPSKVIYFLDVIAITIGLIVTLSSKNGTWIGLDYLLGSLIGGGIFYILLVLSKGKWIGGGDVRLGFLLGFLAGSVGRSLMYIFIASLLGSIVSLAAMGLGKMKKKSLIPFGPFLIIGLIIVQLFGSHIGSWYTNILLGG